MSILVDHEIRKEIKDGRLTIEPYDDKLIQPNSYDVRLADRFSWHDPSEQIIDPYQSETVLQGLVHVVNDSIVIHPKQFVLGATLEKLTLPDDIVGQLTGKSSLARLGVMVHGRDRRLRQCPDHRRFHRRRLQHPAGSDNPRNLQRR